MAGKASQENGKLGGRPKGNHTLTSEVMRQRIQEKLEPHLDAITEVLIKKSKKGDLRAIKELLDRAFGRPMQFDPSENKFNFCFREHVGDED